MNPVYAAQVLGVIATFAASIFTALNARSTNNNARLANESQEDVAHRTVSLSEMETALTFQGTQLRDLRKDMTEASAQIRQLRTLHEECEASKFQLLLQLAELRGRM
jgi:hypothetical protein